MRIILDSNFLIDIFRFKIDLSELEDLIIEPHEIYTVNSVIGELQRIAKTNKKESKYAKLALKLIKTSNIKLLSSPERNTDKAIIALSDKDTIVATNDVALRKKLKTLGRKTIYLRARKYLAIS